MRTALRLSLLFCLPLLAAGCFDAHGRDGDAGVVGDAGGCGGSAPFLCVDACGSDAGVLPVCSSGGGWSCPPGTIDQRSCPPGCLGAPPRPDCVCRGTSWSCPSLMCPTDFNPWDPTDPRSACTPEGATCSSGSTDPCGSAMSCECRSGHWSCAIAEPDPVCTCGRAPSEGDRCVMEGASCGECCPTPGGTGWPAMTCVAGHWTAAACPALDCMPLPVVCPADTLPLVGTTCSIEGALCGDPCCSDAVSCRGGAWVRGPEADCALCSEYVCGTGNCRADQACVSQCGPADGIEYVCTSLPSACRECACMTLTTSQRCEMIDGHPHVSELGFCG